jgi:ABC-type amino acid transport substrate-binding protein
MVLRPILLVKIVILLLLSEANGNGSADILGANKPIMVRHSTKMAENEAYAKQTDYFDTLLKLALKKSDIPTSLKPVKIPTVIDARKALMFEAGMFDVIWLHTSKELESRFLPIRIPLFKGLIGWRVFLIRKENIPVFANAKSIDTLKNLIVGQGNDWPDTTILRANNFNLMTSVHPKNLFDMLVANRLDYFPRSILETENELLFDHNKQLVVEPTLALQYPTAFYFFVRKDNFELAGIIEKGLEASISDGTFDELFYKNFAKDIQQAQFKQRKVFKLSTPKEMFSHLPLERKDLWFQETDSLYE